MAVWQKVKNFLLLVGLGLLAILGVGWAIRRFEGSKKDHFGIDPSQPEIRDNIAGQGTEIDSSLGRIDRIEEIIGNDEERQSETDRIVEESRKARQRATDFLAKLED